MTKMQMVAMVLLGLVLAGACKPQDATPAAPERAQGDKTQADKTQADKTQATTAPTPVCQAADELAQLDQRRSVPLQPMMAWHQKQQMMEHLVAIQRITDGVARGDWDAVAEAAALIESSPQMQQMCRHMGAGAEGFTQRALDFHSRADAIGEAARAHDGPAVLRATSHTLQACTDCHAAFRQRVVDAATWRKLTGQAHDPSMMHGNP